MNRKPRASLDSAIRSVNRWRLAKEIAGAILALASLALFLFALIGR